MAYFGENFLLLCVFIGPVGCINIWLANSSAWSCLVMCDVIKMGSKLVIMTILSTLDYRLLKWMHVHVCVVIGSQ